MEMSAEGNFNVEIQKLMGNIKQKINNDDILNRLLNNNVDYVFEYDNDLSFKCGKELIEIYKKLSILVDKLTKIS